MWDCTKLRIAISRLVELATHWAIERCSLLMLHHYFICYWYNRWSNLVNCSLTVNASCYEVEDYQFELHAWSLPIAYRVLSRWKQDCFLVVMSWSNVVIKRPVLKIRRSWNRIRHFEFLNHASKITLYANL